jgi:PAS domain S-box-containing protein
MIFMVDRDDTMKYVNTAVLKLFRLPSDQVVGTPRKNLFPPEIADSQSIHFKKVFETGEILKTEEKFQFGTQEFWIDTSSVPLKDGAGNVTGVLGIARDITERKRAEEALRSREEQFRIIFHNQQTGLLMIDAVTHTITDANAAALSMIGVSREDVIGKICHTFICPAEKGKCPVTDLGQTVDNSERVLIRANGEKVPILKSVNPVKIGGRPFLIESFIDISERKRAEAALKESNERYISYIKEAAMRLKTPVEVVEQNITTLLEDIRAGDAEGEQVLLQLQLQVKNMEQIRQNILDLNKTIVDGYGEMSPASKQFLTE